MRTTKIECALLAVALGMFAPGFVHAETAGADAVTNRLKDPARSVEWCF
jgi:hypothetical protein